MGEEPEAGRLGEPTWAGAISRDSGNRQRRKPDAQSGNGCFRQATFPQGLTAVVGAGDNRKATPGVACNSKAKPDLRPVGKLPSHTTGQAGHFQVCCG